MSCLFLPESFFDLSRFENRALFDDVFFVWEALSKIAPLFQDKALSSALTKKYEGVIFEYPEMIHIGEGTTIEAGAYIRGPTIIGAKCEIRHGAYIRGNSIIGDKCVIGHATEIKHSILLNGVKAAHFAFIGDSIVGNNVNIGAGAKFANLRFDQQKISVCQDKKKIATGLKKFGSIIGDGAQIGCNTVLAPGTLIGKGSFCYPMLYISGVIPDGSRVRSSEKKRYSIELTNINLD